MQVSFIRTIVAALIVICTFGCSEQVPIGMDGDRKVTNTTSQLTDERHILPDEGVALMGNMLYFQDREVYFETFLAFLQNQQEPRIWRDWASKFNGFVSMRDAYEALTEDDEMAINEQGLGKYSSFLVIEGEDEDNLEVVSVVRNPFEARVVNKEGMIQVGDSVYRYFSTHYLSAYKPNPDQMAQMRNANASSILPFTNVVEINYQILTSANKTQSCGGNTNHVVEYASNPRRRINVTLIYTNPKGGSGLHDHFVFSEVKNQRKNGFWWGRTADSISTELSHNMSIADRAPWAWGPWDINYQQFDDENVKKIDPVVAFASATFKELDFDFSSDNYVRDSGGRVGEASNDNWCSY